MLLEQQTLTTICTLDLAASLAIIFAHITGHHDICNRIHRRLVRLARALVKICRMIGRACILMLQELPKDLEDQSDSPQESLIDMTDDISHWSIHPPLMPGKTISNSATGTLQTQEGSDLEGLSSPFGPGIEERFPLLRRFSSPYKSIHQELGSLNARFRWSSVRYRFGFTKHPFQNMLLLVASQVRSDHHEVELGHTNVSSPLLQLAPAVTQGTRSRSQSISEVVLDIVHRQQTDALGIKHVQRFDTKPQLHKSPSHWHDPPLAPIYQLPGTIRNVCVKALPDTGSSQNIIDMSLVQHLRPLVPIQPVDMTTDKPLVAPDGKPIPCVGKVLLPWVFKNEKETYKRWFYVVRNCSHGVIIGNCFLQETETMSKHEKRLIINKPLDPGSGSFVSEAKQDGYTRQIVFGTVEGVETAASLDTGCEANLMSAHCADSLVLEIVPPPMGEQHIKFADGRMGPTLGQVEVSWSFRDTPNVTTKVRCHVLTTCIHPLIFGDRFVFSEKPWAKHPSSLDQMNTITAYTGVVGLEKIHSLWPFRSYKPGTLK